MAAQQQPVSEAKYMTASIFTIQPQLARLKVPRMMLVIVKGVIDEAERRGLNLMELSIEELATLIPSESLLAVAIELWQDTIDLVNSDDLTDADYVHFDLDAGNKKARKLTYRVVAAYNKQQRCVFMRFVACSTVPTGQHAKVVWQDSARLGIKDAKIRGSCTDSAADVPVTFVNDMTALFPLFLGAACTLHILHLMMMRAVLTTFGEQIKPGASGGAGQNGVLRTPSMAYCPISLKPCTWYMWAKPNGYATIAFSGRRRATACLRGERPWSCRLSTRAGGVVSPTCAVQWRGASFANAAAGWSRRPCRIPGRAPCTARPPRPRQGPHP